MQKIRNRADGGFTLIELLVVMIIISILMAVAVPVFLGQKQKALATNAKVNVKNIHDTIEACGASLTNGTLQEGAFNCRAITEIQAAEPSLSKLFTGATCESGACVSVTNLTPADPNTYRIIGKTVGAPADVTEFYLDRSQTDVVRTCENSSAANRKVCPTGTF